jgi:branched-chain amino acid transport system permease protein
VESVPLEVVLQAVMNGLIIGGIYALVAGGLTLVFGVMGIINVAHGDLLMVSMFASYYAVTLLGLSPYAAIFLVSPIMFLVGMAIFRGFIVPVLDAPVMNQILLTVALSLLIQNIAALAFGGDYLTVDLPIADRTVDVLGAVLSLPQLLAFVLSLVATGACYAMLRYTDFGCALRAVAQNRQGAALVGINVRFVYMLAFGLGCGLLGVAGPLLTPIYYVHPDVGSLFLLVAFVVVVMGGLGNFLGALAAALIIGVMESVAGVFVSASLAPIANFAVFILALLFRPQGLFRARGR